VSGKPAGGGRVRRRSGSEVPGKFRTIADAAPFMVWTVDGQGELSFLSAAFRAFGGEHNGRLVLAEWVDRIHPEDRESVLMTFRAATSTRQPFKLECRVLRADGEYRWLQVNGVPESNGTRHKGYVGTAMDVTTRRRGETALRESEARYRGIFEGANDPIIVFEPEGEVILDANPRACEVYGIPRDELIGTSLKAMTRDVSRGEEQIRQTLRDGRYHNFETVHFRKDGSEIRFAVNASVIEYGGRPAILSINRVLGPLLSEKEEWYRSFIEENLDGIWLAELTTPVPTSLPPEEQARLILEHAACVEYNRAMAGTEGLDPGASGKRLPLAALFQHDDPTPGEIVTLFVGAGYRLHDAQWRSTPAGSGARYFVNTLLGAVEDGALVRIWGSRRDVTEALQAERKLRLLGQTIASAKDCVVITDMRHRILFVNEAFLQIYRYTDMDLLGQEVWKVHADEMSADIRRELTADNGAAGWHGEILERRGDNSVMPVELWMSVVRNDDGVPVALVGVARDISERKRAEEQIRASLREKEVLLKEIHHRVKNNLQIVSSLLSLQTEYIRDPEMLRIFRESQARVKSMALIHEKLYRSTNLAQIDFGEYLRELTIHLFRSYDAPARGLELVLDVEPVVLGLDRSIPSGIIVNELVSNALKYAFPDGTRGVITVRFRATGPGLAELSVIDNGVGMPEGFVVGSTDSLGLKLVTMLAGQLGGTMSVGFGSGGGSEFKLQFPIA
jgi:PAS domain S-box-containing protein